MDEHLIEVAGGPSFRVPAGEPSLLRGALRAGVGLPHECGVGGCGSCRFELVSGELATLWAEAPGLSERERKRGKRLACQSRPLSDCSIRVRTSAEYVLPVPPRLQPVELVERRLLTGDMAHLTLRSAGPATFLAGQFALLTLPNTTGPRAYSMCNQANQDGRWEFIVRRVPGGAGTTALFERLQPGDPLELDGPFGFAFWRAGLPRDTVCIAGGSGLAPMLSVAEAALATGQGVVHFFHGVRTPQDLCAEPFLSRLPGAGQRLRFTPVVSDPGAAEGWPGARGFVHEALEAGLPGPLAGYEYYFAGPPPMITAVQQLLLSGGVPHERLHFDRFL